MTQNKMSKRTGSEGWKGPTLFLVMMTTPALCLFLFVLEPHLAQILGVTCVIPVVPGTSRAVPNNVLGGIICSARGQLGSAACKAGALTHLYLSDPHLLLITTQKSF